MAISAIMDNPDQIAKTVINVKGVDQPAWEAAKRGAARTGDSMGKYLSRAIYTQEKIDAGAIIPPRTGLASVKNGADDGNPELTEDQRTARIQALAAMMQALAAVKTATGRASGKEVVMQEVWALRTKQIPYRPRAPIHNGSTEQPTDSVDGTPAP